MPGSKKKKRLMEAAKKGGESRKKNLEKRRDQDSAELDVAFDAAVDSIEDVLAVDSEDAEPPPPAVPQMAPKDVVMQQTRFVGTMKRTKRKTVYACRSMKGNTAKATRRWKANRRRAIEIEEEEERPHSAPPILPSDCPMDLDLPPPRPASADFIKRPPLRTIADPEKASKRTLRRRKADIQKLIQKTLPNQYELRPSSQQNSGLNATDVLEFVANNNCSFNLVRQISKRGKGPSVRQVYKKKDEVLKEMPANTTRMLGAHFQNKALKESTTASISATKEPPRSSQTASKPFCNHLPSIRLSKIFFP